MHETTVVAAEETVTATVVEALAEETGRDPFELPPLYEAVDTDALNRLVDHTRADRDSNVTVTFAAAGCTVEITGAGEVRVTGSGEARNTDSSEARVESGRERLDADSAGAHPEATTDKSVTAESVATSDSETVEPPASNPAAE